MAAKKGKSASKSTAKKAPAKAKPKAKPKPKTTTTKDWFADLDAELDKKTEKALGIDEGQTTQDMLFYLETVACLGTCFLAPAIMIDDEYFGNLTPQRVESVLDSYRASKT